MTFVLICDVAGRAAVDPQRPATQSTALTRAVAVEPEARQQIEHTRVVNL
jgi:hypothetical protein